jgi:hypothetical protein
MGKKIKYLSGLLKRISGKIKRDIREHNLSDVEYILGDNYEMEKKEA